MALTACVYQNSRVRQSNKQKPPICLDEAALHQADTAKHTQSTADRRILLEFLTELECKDIQQPKLKSVPHISLQLTQLNACSWQHPLIWNETKEVIFQGWQTKSWSVIKGINKYSQ